jgi:hypothetical protein
MSITPAGGRDHAAHRPRHHRRLREARSPLAVAKRRKLRAVFEAAGVEFTDGEPGVKLKAKARTSAAGI